MEHLFNQKMSDLVELGYGAQIVKSSIAEVILVIQSTPGQSEPNPNREELQAAKQKVQMLEIDVKRLEDVARKAEDDLAAIDIFAPVDILSFENNDSVIDLAGIVKRALATGDSEKIKGTDVEARTMWLAAREQVHELLCTKSPRYSNERVVFDSTVTPSISVITAHLMVNFSVAAQAAGGIATLALLIAIKVAKNAWCATFDKTKVHRDEIAELEKVSERPKKIRNV